jgi:hypothetical protein
MGGRGLAGNAVELFGPQACIASTGATWVPANPKTLFHRLATQIDSDRVKARDPAWRLLA